jgi:hypothetical protein
MHMRLAGAFFDCGWSLLNHGVADELLAVLL